MPRRLADAQLVAILGARGCGKSTSVRQALDTLKPQRLAVWDTKREHGLEATSNLGQFIRSLKGASWRVAFHPTIGDPKKLEQEFEFFCLAVYQARRCTAIVEELAFVTKPNRAPPGWRTLLLLGRDENEKGGRVSVITTAQRPASVDKDLLGNCTTIRSGRLPYEEDARPVARSLGVDFRELMSLPPLAWIEKTDRDKEARRGTLVHGARGLGVDSAKRHGKREAKAPQIESSGQSRKGVRQDQ